MSLKRKGKEKGLLVIPGRRTVIIDGKAPGFIMRSRRKCRGHRLFGIGMQETTVLLDRGGLGTSYAIGVGSKDMTEEIDGTMTKMAIESLGVSDGLIIIGKKPDKRVKDEILSMIKGRKAAFISLGESEEHIEGDILSTGSIDRGVDHILKAMGKAELREAAPKESAKLDGRKYLRGLFVGGSLCYQAQAIIGKAGIKVYSNAPTKKELSLRMITITSTCASTPVPRSMQRQAPSDDRSQPGTRGWSRRAGGTMSRAAVRDHARLGKRR